MSLPWGGESQQARLMDAAVTECLNAITKRGLQGLHPMAMLTAAFGVPMNTINAITNGATIKVQIQPEHADIERLLLMRQLFVEIHTLLGTEGLDMIDQALAKAQSIVGVPEEVAPHERTEMLTPDELTAMFRGSRVRHEG